MHKQFCVPVDTLGFPEDESTDTGHHYCFDLNEAQWHERWRDDLPAYDVIVMAEVIEHLYTSPTLVLGFLKTLLKPGGFLVIQTPNAAAFGKRIKLLFGINPYNLIDENNTNPKHFREYTEQELKRYAARVDFEVLEVIHASYFDHRYSKHDRPTILDTVKGTVQNVVYRKLPRHLRTGITIVMKRLDN